MHTPESAPSLLSEQPDVDFLLAAVRTQIAAKAATDTGQPDNPEAVAAAFHSSLLSRLGTPDEFPAYHRLFRDSLIKHPARMPINIARLEVRKAQDFFLRSQWPDLTYPVGFDDPEAWTPFYEAVETDARLPGSKFPYGEQLHYEKNTDYNVHTNIPDRYALFKAAALYLGKQGPQQVLDLGCGRQHGAKKLAVPRRSQYDYGAVEVMNAAEGLRQVPHLPATRELYRLLNSDNLPISRVIGIDIQNLVQNPDPIEAKKLRTWSRNCFYPEEYLGGAPRVQEFSILDDLELTDDKGNNVVQFYQNDVTQLNHQEFEQTFPDLEQFDMAVMSTVGYQLGEAGVKAAIANVQKYMKPDGHIMLLDYVDIDGDGRMHFSKDQRNWSYKLHVLSMAEQEEGFQKFFTVETGRAKRLAYAPYAARLAFS
jgi:hypothetical protein